jgi:micrococcal nuclease
MIRTILLALALAAATPAAARDFSAQFSRVKDGDTVELLKPRPFGIPVSIRIKGSRTGIDTPERDGPCDGERSAAASAKLYLTDLLLRAGMRGMVRMPRTDKFGSRYDAQILVRIDGRRVNVGDTLLASGHAVPYDGRQRRDWCAAPIDLLPPGFPRR